MAAIVRAFSSCLLPVKQDKQHADPMPPIMMSYPYGIIALDSEISSVEIRKSPSYMRTSIEIPDDAFDAHCGNPYIDAHFSQRRAAMTIYKLARSRTEVSISKLRTNSSEDYSTTLSSSEN